MKGFISTPLLNGILVLSAPTGLNTYGLGAGVVPESEAMLSSLAEPAAVSAVKSNGPLANELNPCPPVSNPSKNLCTGLATVLSISNILCI